MSAADVESAVEEVMEHVSDAGDNTSRFSQQESVDFYEGVAHECTTRANLIRSEME